MKNVFKTLVPVALLAAGAAGAQNFPGDKPITLIVPFSAGGPTDRVARDLAESLRKPLGGATVVVDNSAGAGGSIGANKVAKAAPTWRTNPRAPRAATSDAPRRLIRRKVPQPIP